MRADRRYTTISLPLNKEALMTKIVIDTRGGDNGDKVMTVINTSDLYGKERGVLSSRRGYLFTDKRSSLVIRDEVSLCRESVLRWHLNTDALIEVDKARATLRDKDDKDKYITVEFSSTHPIEVGFERALPLPTSPDVPGQRQNEGFYRLYCKTLADGDVTITAKINTCKDGVTLLSDYDVSIDTWKI